MNNVVLAGGVRTPIGNFLGTLSGISVPKLGSIVIKEALARTKLKPDQVEEIILGNILQGGSGQNIARQAALLSDIPYTVPAMTLNMVCGSGMRALVDAARQIKLGEADIIVAGGVESMSKAPYIVDGARTGCKYGTTEFVDLILRDGLMCPINSVHMGITAENVAETYGISREAQDQFAYESQQKAAKAQAEGKFDEEIVPVEIPQRRGEPVLFKKDEYVKPETKLDRLAGLRPAFKKDGTVTAGNSSGINDGSAAVVVLSENKARDLGITPLGRIKGYAYAGVDPALMGIGPIDAVKKLLAQHELTINDIDLIEANEAFAAQSLGVGKGLGWDPARVNVNGGAIALGHPIGSSGCRIVVSLMYEMRRRKAKLGLATLCIGGGMGIAILVEAC